MSIRELRRYKTKTINSVDSMVIRLRRFVPYEVILADASQHKATFVQDIKRQTANRAEKVLSNKFGSKIVAFPALSDGKKGYIFMREEDIPT